MVTVLAFEVSTPAAGWVKFFPVGPQSRVACRISEENALTVEIEVGCQSYEMEAVADPLPLLGIQLCHSCITSNLANGNFKALTDRFPDKLAK